MIEVIEERTNKGFEIQWYDKQGRNSRVTHCDTVTEVAQALARACWGCNIDGGSSNPTVWKDGQKWCFGEYTD